MGRGFLERVRPALDILRETFSQWLAERAPRMAAAIAFYTIFSLAPLLIVVVAIAGFVFGQEAAQDRIMDQIEYLIGPDGARTVLELFESAQRPAAVGLIASAVGVATMLVGASGVFGELQDSLNTIWNVKATRQTGLLRLLRDRFVSFAMVIGVGFLLLVSLTISAALSALTDFAGQLVPTLLPVLQIVECVVSLVGVAVLFALLFSFVPNADIAWRDVWPGAVVTSVLFAIGKLAISFYLGHSAFSSTYGAVGSLVVVLLWVYYSAQIVLFGAELTQVYTTSRRKVAPSAGAVRAHGMQNPRRLQAGQGSGS